MCPRGRRRATNRRSGRFHAGSLLPRLFGASRYAQGFLRVKAGLGSGVHARPGDDCPRWSPRFELSHLQLLEAWEEAAQRADRPMTAADRDVFREARARCTPAGELYGWSTVPIPCSGAAPLRRLMGALAVPDGSLGRVIDLEGLAAEVGRSRRSIVRDLAELERQGRVSRLPLWGGLLDDARVRSASAIVLHPLETQWDRCPRLWVRAAYAPLLAAVYTAHYQGRGAIELDGARVGRSERTFWRYVSRMEALDLLVVDRQPGQRNRYRAGPALLSWSHQAEAELRAQHRSREYRAQRERVPVPGPLRSSDQWDTHRITCLSGEHDSLTPHNQLSEISRNSGFSSGSGRDPPGPALGVAARSSPELRSNLAFKTYIPPSKVPRAPAGARPNTPRADALIEQIASNDSSLGATIRAALAGYRAHRW